MTPKTMIEPTLDKSVQATGIASEREAGGGCERCARRPKSSESSWDRPVEVSVGDHTFLDLHIHPTLKIQPEPMVDEP